MIESQMILTALSVLFAAVAAAAAWKSAVTAKQAVKVSEASDLRTAIERASMTAKDCSLMSAQIAGLERELKSALLTSQAARGVRSDSATEIMTRYASEKLMEAQRLCEGLPSYLPPKSGTLIKTPEDAHAANIHLGAVLRDLQVIRDDMQARIVKVNEGARGAIQARRIGGGA